MGLIKGKLDDVFGQFAIMLLSWSICVNTDASRGSFVLIFSACCLSMDVVSRARRAARSLGLNRLDNLLKRANKLIKLPFFCAWVASWVTSLLSECADPTAHYGLLIVCIYTWKDKISCYLPKDFGNKLKSLLKTRKIKCLVWTIAIIFYFELSLDGNKLEGFSRVFCKLEKHELDCLVDMHNVPPQSAKDCALNGSDFCGALLPQSTHLM